MYLKCEFTFWNMSEKNSLPPKEIVASPCSQVEHVHSTHFMLHKVACVGHKWLEIVYQSDLDNICGMKFIQEEPNLFVLLVCHIEISQTMAPLVTLVRSPKPWLFLPHSCNLPNHGTFRCTCGIIGNPFISRSALRLFHNISTYHEY